jgi:adenylosuccinate synthase
MKQYNELPETFRNYMEYVEKQIQVPVSIISVGPDREETIVK